jgi:hypothetical protein
MKATIWSLLLRGGFSVFSIFFTLSLLSFGSTGGKSSLIGGHHPRRFTIKINPNGTFR